MLWCIKEALYNPRTACRYVDGNINGRCYFTSFCLEDDYIALCVEKYNFPIISILLVI